MWLKSPIMRVSRMASWLSLVLHYAVYGQHPKRAAIAATYLRLRVRLAVSKKPLHRISLLGNEVHFTNDRSFEFLFSELFIQETYHVSEQAPATIVDCGSNIGLSILLFKSLWPSAQITGIEASHETFALLKENVKDIPGVTLINKAVSDRHGLIPFYSGDADRGRWSTNARRGGTRETVVESAPLSLFITGSVDLLKIDIEGSEIAAFAELEASGKMRLIREMLIEYHHHLPGETHGLSSFLDRLERCGFDYELEASMPRALGDFQDVLIRARRI